MSPRRPPRPPRPPAPEQLLVDLVRPVLGPALRLAQELVPVEAQLHLLRAQRELLLALAATWSHHHPGLAAAPARARSSRRHTIPVD
ncbi:MAG TPA: hypothetical protein VMW49_03220 [Candidatus Dormibacteraeota bacterium]|nr:hypothetical protein [Candidatus Dormibacteraeota bacterium]